MRIVALAKQVPATTDVRMDAVTGTMVREGKDAVLNPLDLYAIEAALRFRETFGGTVDVVSMGPRRAELAVREAIAMGCDDGYLVSDRAFAGSDTWATSYVLAEVVRSIGPVDLVVAGERATDGDTGQVGPAVASWLDLPCITYVAAWQPPPREDVHTAWQTVLLERLVEAGYQQVAVRLPALITVVKEIAEPRLPTLAGKKRAHAQEVRILTTNDLDLDPTHLGLAGSPTRVVSIRSPKVARGGHRIDARSDVATAVTDLLSFLRDRGHLPEADT